MRKRWIAVGIGILLILIWGTSKERVQRQEEMESRMPKISEKIRVLIKSENFEKNTHNNICISAPSGLRILYGDQEIQIKGNEYFALQNDSDLFLDGTVKVLPQKDSDEMTLHHMKRGCGEPAYNGELELFWAEEGIVIVNEVNMEEYLQRVVPSEMPASYEMEALKVQAVCARSYAERMRQSEAYPEYRAHVDDSTSYQVYGNSKKNERTSQAVMVTQGKVVSFQDEIANTYFYSTSCGRTTSLEAWGNENGAAYLTSVNVSDENGEDYERALPWYRWSIQVSNVDMERIIESYMMEDIGTLQNVIVNKRGAGNVATQIKAIGTAGEIVVETENKIRRALGDNCLQIKRQDGTIVNCGELIPSAFISIEKASEIYVISGGGYGHGIGMSQNGANEMAKRGKNYVEILKFFYVGTEVVSS